MTADELVQSHCQPRKGEPVLVESRVKDLMTAVDGWAVSADGKSISHDFKFGNFYETLGFVNAVGWMANRQDHHPDLEVSYGHCTVRWSTHDVGGLSVNDFICAAKVDAIAKA